MGEKLEEASKSISAFHRGPANAEHHTPAPAERSTYITLDASERFMEQTIICCENMVPGAWPEGHNLSALVECGLGNRCGRIVGNMKGYKNV